MPAVVTKRPIMTPPEKAVAREYRRWLKQGGKKLSYPVRVAAFDRIADKHFKRENEA